MSSSQPAEVDPAASAQWLGVPIALLEAPGHLSSYSQLFADSRPWGAGTMARGDLQPLPTRLTIRYHLHDDSNIAVVTGRTHLGFPTVTSMLWDALTGYQLESAMTARKIGPKEPGRRMQLLDPRGVPAELIYHRMSIDEVVDDGWIAQPDTDTASAEALTACAGRVGDSLVAVVGPTTHVAEVKLRMWATPS